MKPDIRTYMDFPIENQALWRTQAVFRLSKPWKWNKNSRIFKDFQVRNAVLNAQPCQSNNVLTAISSFMKVCLKSPF